MPYSPNFVFTDPVAASQLVSLAQIAQAEDAARNQMMLGTLQALGQQNVARSNADAERSRYQSNADIRRQEMKFQADEAERNRVARSGEVDRTIAANKDIAKMDADARTGVLTRNRQDAANVEEYNFVLSQVEGGDPPTDEEFRAMSLNLAPERAARLDNIRKQNISALSRAADNADAFANYWNARLKKLGASNKVESLESIIAEATKSQAGKFIIYDPQAGLFRSALPRPRAAQVIAAPPAVEGIQDLLKRTAPPAPPASGVPSMAPPLSFPPSYMNMGGLWRFPSSPPVAPAVPPLPAVPVPGLTPNELDAYSGRPYIPIPPAR